MAESPGAPVGVFSKCPPVKIEVRPNGEASPLLTLSYFAMKGRAEVCRLMLEEAQVPYDMYTCWVGPDWKEGKKKDAPFGMLPVLELPDGQTVAQSSTIVRRLAKMTSLEGGPGEADRTRADMVYETALELKDLKSELAPGAEHSDLQSMIDGKAGNQKWGKLLGLLAGLERLLKEAGGQFFVGGSLSYADLAVFNTFSYFEAVSVGCLRTLGFHSLASFYEAIGIRPGVAAYLASDRCYPFTELEVLTPGYQANGQPMGLKYVKPLSDSQWQQAAVSHPVANGVSNHPAACRHVGSRRLGPPAWLLPLTVGLASGLVLGALAAGRVPGRPRGRAG